MAETSDLPDAATVFSKRYDRYLRAYLSALGGDTFHARVYAGRFSPELAIEGEDELIVRAGQVWMLVAERVERRLRAGAIAGVEVPCGEKEPAGDLQSIEGHGASPRIQARTAAVSSGESSSSRASRGMP